MQQSEGLRISQLSTNNLLTGYSTNQKELNNGIIPI